MEKRKKRNKILIVCFTCLAIIIVGFSAYKMVLSRYFLGQPTQQEVDIIEQKENDISEQNSIEKKEEQFSNDEIEEKEEEQEKLEPLLEEKIDIADTYCVIGNNALFYVYKPQCNQYNWEYYNRKTAKWCSVKDLDDVKVNTEVDEYNRQVSILNVPAKSEYDSLEVRCNVGGESVKTAHLYVIEQFESLTVPKEYETAACKLIYTNEIPVSVTYKDGTAREFRGLQGLYFSYEVSSKEDVQKNQNEVTQTVTTVSAEERSYMPLLGSNPIEVRYRNEADTEDFDINLIGKDDQPPTIISFELSDYQVVPKDTKDGTLITVTIEAEDNCTGNLELLYYFGLDSEKMPEKEEFSSESQQSIYTNKNGMYGIYVMDSAGNVSKELTELIVVDTKAPKIISLSLEYPEMDRWYDSNIIHVEAEDKTEISYSYACDGVDSGYISDDFYVVTTNGKWTIAIKDEAGNVTTKEIEITNIDHVPPRILNISQKSSYTQNRKSAEVSEKEETTVIYGIDGKDGRDGRDGLDGSDGRDGIDGRDGKGQTGTPGVAGKSGKDGEDGNSLFVKYSANVDGSDMTDKPNATSKYMGTYVGKTVSTNPADYTWTRYSDATISYSDGTLYITQ